MYRRRLAFSNDRIRRRVSLISDHGVSTEQTGRERILRRDEYLFHAGEALDHAYEIIAGVLKTYLVHESGEEQVLGFHLPGDIVGLDSLVDGAAAFNAVALDTSSVRTLTPGNLHGPGGTCEDASDTAAVIRGMQREIIRLTRMLHLARGSTEARLATFLLDFAAFQRGRGCNQNELILPMKRRDLAHYLGLATETLSRTFTRLRDKGLVSVDNNHVAIRDRVGLQALTGTTEGPPSRRVHPESSG